MSAGGASKKSIQVKYKKISFKDLEFDQGDDFFERGQFGDVKRARWNGKVVAVKCFTSADRKGGFSEELVCLSLLQSHEHIVEMHGASVSDHPFIVLEFAPMSLEKVLHDKGKKQYRYHAEHVMSWSRQIALALEYIHNKDMLHRDIKPSNVLLFKDGLLLKLCDFGTAKKLEHTLTNAVGTIRYMAPEVIRGRYYTASCDAFSFGIVVWEMITRKRPTLGAGKSQHSNMAILYAMANGQRPPKIANIPKALQEMITKCWDNEPQNRPTMIEIRVKLEKLCEYVDDARPLISKRQQKKKEEPTQGDIFASSRTNTQHENPDYKKEPGKEEGSSSSGGGGGGGGGGGARSLGSSLGGGGRGESESHGVASPAPKADEPPPIPPHPTQPPQETSEQFRDRAVTLPRPKRLNDYAGRVGGGPSNVGIPATDHAAGSGQEQVQRQQYTKQISSPEVSHQSRGGSSNFHGHIQPPLSISPSFTGSPSNDFRYHPQFFHPGRQVSEYGNFQTELSGSGTENILREQSERFAHYESEAMKKKEPSHGPFTSVTSSPYYIPGLEPDLQPVIPVEDNPESKELYRQYRIVAEQIKRAKKEYENLLEESANLDKELKYDRQKLEANRGLTQEHQRLLVQRERLVAELQEHQEKLSKLMVQNDQFNN